MNLEMDKSIDVKLLGPSSAGKPPSPQGNPPIQAPEQRYGPQAKTVTAPPGPTRLKNS
jgi:hypothetical protein